MSENRCAALVVDADGTANAALTRLLEQHGCEVESAESVARAEELLTRRRFDLAFVDDGAEDAVGLLRRLAGGRVRAVFGMTTTPRVAAIAAALRAGAVDVLAKPLGDAEIAPLARALRPTTDNIDAWRQRAGIELWGDDAATHDVLRFIRKVADSPATVLITGESGTGKEVVAQALHRASSRREQPMIALNCAAIPESLLEAELFGHAKGAFTGADRAREGKLAAADGGTLFLDEIGDMPLHAQAKLLRVLQERSVTPVGSSTPIAINVRVVAATNQDLERLVDEGKFRADLYFRLSVLTFDLLPLRERPGDILPLARAMFVRAQQAHGVRTATLHPSAEAALVAYGYPGNVRELGNIIERAVALAEGPVMAADLRLGPKVRAPRRLLAVAPMVAAANDSPAQLGRSVTMPAAVAAAVAAMPMPTAAELMAAETLNLRARLDEVERRVIEAALDRAEGNRTEAAALLGLNRTTLVEKLRKLGT